MIHENTYHSTTASNGARQTNEKLPSNGTTVDRPDLEEVHQHNQIVKSAAYRAIKRPGRSNLSLHISKYFDRIYSKFNFPRFHWSI